MVYFLVKLLAKSALAICLYVQYFCRVLLLLLCNLFKISINKTTPFQQNLKLGLQPFIHESRELIHKQSNAYCCMLNTCVYTRAGFTKRGIEQEGCVSPLSSGEYSSLPSHIHFSSAHIFWQMLWGGRNSTSNWRHCFVLSATPTIKPPPTRPALQDYGIAFRLTQLPQRPRNLL